MVTKQSSEATHRLLELLADGQPNKEIAKEFGISEAAVKKAIARLMARYDVPSRAALVAAAIRAGAIH